MAEANQSEAVLGSDVLSKASNPFVFISHDARDFELAEEFSKLLRSVSAGMIKTFRSSDKRGAEGIDFGEEWYKRLMETLQSTSDVVCLFTERSVDRPWILFEAGVAKGKLNTPVVGLALGVPLSRVSTGPFYQFQNMDDSEEDLTKLINQLAKRAPGVELDAGVVKTQVASFKAAEAEILKKIDAVGGRKERKEAADEGPVARLVEEMKALPSRVVERLTDADDPILRRRRMRRIHPGMLLETIEMAGDPGDPVPILLTASLVRDDAPWLYELIMEVYRAAKSNDPGAIESEMNRLLRFSEAMRGHPFFDNVGYGGPEGYMFIRELLHVLRHMVSRTRLAPKSSMRRRLARPEGSEAAKS